MKKPGFLSAIFAAIVLLLVFLTDYYYFFYCVLTAILILFWHLLVNKNFKFYFRKEYLQSFSLFGFLSLLLIGPTLGSFILQNIQDPFLGSHNPLDYLVGLTSLFIPGKYWRFSEWTRVFWEGLKGNSHGTSVSLSLSVYVFLIFAWVKRKSIKLVSNQQINMWFFILCFFLLMSLGTALQINGKVVWDKWMPYSLLVNILPFLKLSGKPGNMVIIFFLSASILSAVAIKQLFTETRWAKGISFLLIILLILQSIPQPIHTIELNVPAYVTFLSNLPEEGAVLDLVANKPFKDNEFWAGPDNSLPMLYQTIHQKADGLRVCCQAPCMRERQR